MENNHLQNELKVMAQAVMTMEQDLHKLDMLELEILAVKAGYKQQLSTFKNAICVLLGGISADKLFDDLTECAEGKALAPTTQTKTIK